MKQLVKYQHNQVANICELVATNKDVFQNGTIEESSFSLLGVKIWNGRMERAVDWLIDRALYRKSSVIGFVNANNLNIAYQDCELRRHYNRVCDRVFADGSGVRLGAAIKGVNVVENVNGTDMLPLLCSHACQSGVSIFLLGAKPGTAAQAAKNLLVRFPQLKIAGTHHGYLNDELSCKRAIKRINEAKPDILLVAMGTPLQEKWLTQNLAKIECPVKMSVGGLFDFFAENVSRAPLWMRGIGCEWVWRIIQEPSRMWRRYILGNPLFLSRVCYELIKGGGDETNSQLEQTQSKSKSQSKAQNNLLSLNLKAFLFLKRGIDIFASLMLLALFTPLFLLVAVAIKLDSKGGLLYSQDRIGRGGKKFKFWKFRSMSDDADASLVTIEKDNESAGNVLFKIKSDPRITRVGKFIRRFSIDELPQLWNVLKGDMSLVGPRPCLPRELAKYQLSDRVRLAIKPGITCFWQVGGRSELSFSQQIQLDKKYIQERSILTDFKILLLTIPAVLSGKGAY
ncbi:MAG: WecB/TagA/CpsF family glycosyltransferase [Kangiellaceae bacterium]|nr:WecB/TagA/CpsF family glycosyltransferase [Kangiellaceae bacterium]MCW8997545.1 WecB/TagA/CpsF family glycosyltransferase [Kangiellaceae bacterium]